ncbi:thioesterase II family protein [Dickeya poaceiphila]|uniref:Thioesterase n=1 Tax=Dickeya poaceiphila TaxID=568768 RepID=A0A5B8IIL9_9GAMM|nr:alpha/beta fold hydrolase [Dickeya poaceiphila]QDX31417.1 thioesterase [Dickeya poaceiphila]
MRCYAFGYAGSSDNAFIALNADWPRTLPLQQYVYPGRGSRMSDEFAPSLMMLARQAAEDIAGPEPVILLGYSFGALVAYETARYLRSQNRPVAGLVVCAMNAPHQQLPSRQVHTFDLPTLIVYLTTLGGTPAELLASTELMRWFAPVIQCDYRLLDAYRPESGDALDCPIVALYGEGDALTTLSGIAAWRDCTTVSFHSTAIAGGHFFLLNQPQSTLSSLFRLLSAALST